MVALLASLTLACTTGAVLRGGETTAEPYYGYAPFVWIAVDRCDNRWCTGTSKTSFTLNTDTSDPGNKTCTHYCIGKIFARWRPLTDADLKLSERDKYMLGAYVCSLDENSCLPVPGGFSCSDHVVSTIPLNKLSVLLHASDKNKAYYFGSDPESDSGQDPQCVTYRLLRRTMYASPAERRWPTSDEVLTIRNSPYACILSYIGLGDTESLGSCYSQLGDSCFESEGNHFCVNGSDSENVGITNADDGASAPIAICELSSRAELESREPAHRPGLAEINAFLAPSACDAVVVPVEAIVRDDKRVSVEAYVTLFHNLSELAHVIPRLNLSRCLLKTVPTGQDVSTELKAFARTIANVMLSTYSNAILLDVSEWNRETACENVRTDINITTVVVALGSELRSLGVRKILLRLYPSPRAFECEDYEAMLRVIHAFVSPRGVADMKTSGSCQNIWSPESGGGERGVLAYVLITLRNCVPTNKFIFTLALTGGIAISPLEGDKKARSLGIVNELPLAELESNTMLKCEENIRTKCCSGSSVTVWGRDVKVSINVTSTSFETLKRFPELMTVAFGVNQFVVSPVDSDFKRGIRSNTPAILGITSAIHRLRDRRGQQPASTTTARHRRAIDDDAVKKLDPAQVSPPSSPETHKDPSSGSKTNLDPQYTVGLGNRIVCPGLIAVHGALGLFKESYRELHGTSYETIFAAHLYKLESCTPGPPSRRAVRSERAPQIAINVNTLIPTTDPSHYAIGILDSTHIVEYVPVASKVCETYNAGETELNMNVVVVDDGYVIDKPTVEHKDDFIVKPAETVFFVSNFTPGVDYINLNVKCVNYDVSALQPCLIAICGGDHACARDYGRLCNSAHEIMNDARRAGEIMREGLRELAVQETKAKMYAMPDNAPFPGLDKPQPHRRKRLVGILLGVGALSYGYYLSTRIDKLEAQMDALQNSYMEVSGQLVEVSKKLDTKISMVNGRIDEQERSMRKNTEMVNSNFALLRDAVMRNTEAAMRDTNVKFSVMAGYQMWYAQMQSITHQMMQAAMHVKFMARGVENCLRQIATKRSGSCPSGMSIIQEHPGLADFPTVGAALYKDRKLFIIHAVPGTVERTTIRKIIPMPKMSTDQVPCWPDYRVWLIDGKFYEPSECFGKYCHDPEPHSRYTLCRRNPVECKTVCSACHRGICYRDNKFTWLEGTAAVEITSPPLRPFSRPHISDGPMSFADLIKDALPDTPEADVIRAINTSVRLIDVQEDLNNITQNLNDFDRMYKEISASRVTFGGWLSGFASDAALWMSVAVLMAWCTALSAGIAYMFFCGGGGGGGQPSPPRGYKMMKRL